VLIYDSSEYLGDKRLSPEEGNFKIREGNQKLIDEKKLRGQSLLENKDMAMSGMAMQPSEFIRKIQKINSSIIVEKGGYPDCVAVRYPTYDEDEHKIVRKYVSGFPVNEMMQEFSHITVDAKGLPHREVRGWRSVLLALIKQGILTYPQVKAAFGEPTGQRNVLWNEQMRERKQ
jgi:hypothetical protein